MGSGQPLGIQMVTGSRAGEASWSLGPPLFTGSCTCFLGMVPGTTRHKWVHELKGEILLLFHRKLYKLVIKTSMGS